MGVQVTIIIVATFLSSPVVSFNLSSDLFEFLSHDTTCCFNHKCINRHCWSGFDWLSEDERYSGFEQNLCDAHMDAAGQTDGQLIY